MQVRLGVLTNVENTEQAVALRDAVKSLIEGGQFEGVSGRVSVRLETRSFGENGERQDTRQDLSVYLYNESNEFEVEDEDEFATDKSFSQKLGEKLGF